MVEVLVAGAFVTGAVVAFSKKQIAAPTTAGADDRDGDATDLPCPWCSSATTEEDRRCPGCGQRFG